MKSKTKIIKLSTGINEYKFIRQTPGSEGVWGQYKFIENEAIQNCDYYFVFNNIQKAETIRSKHSAILITAEPESIIKYPKKYLKQFDYVVTSQRDLKHPNLIHTQQALPWHIGIQKADKLQHKITKVNIDYDILNKQNKIKKTKLLSVITSAKTITPGHVERINFVKKLQTHFGNKIDVFGAGFSHIEDKWDAIAPYKYHIAIENSSYKDYWTEKLSDTFLAGAYPIYYGCPNIYDYFSENSLTPIDVRNPQAAIKAIEDAVNSKKYENSLPDINKARELVLNQYNLFPAIIDIIENHADHKKLKPINKTIKPLSYFSNKKPSVARKIKNKIKYYLKKL